MFFLLFLITTTSYASALPVLKISKKWSECVVAIDCVVAGDACRSCSNVIIINKKYAKDFLLLDEKARKKVNFFPACEACSAANIKLQCNNEICEHQ